MKNMSLQKIADACGGTYHGPEESLSREVSCVVIDSRKIQKDGLFIAIRGARVDGHTFIPQVMEKGALCSVSEQDLGDVPYPYIKVDSCEQALKDIAEILRHHFRKEDMIGRLGGDEFVVLLKNVDTEESVCQLASQLNQALEKTYAQGGYSVTISASIGIALAYEDGITFEELYEKADLALYEVKRGQRNGYKIYTQALEDTEDTAKGETAKV